MGLRTLIIKAPILPQDKGPLFSETPRSCRHAIRGDASVPCRARFWHSRPMLCMQPTDLRICMYLNIYIYIYICMVYMYVYIYIYIYIFLYIYIYIFIYTCIAILCVYICAYAYTHACMHACMHACIHMNMHMQVIYTHTCVCIYVCTHLHWVCMYALS